MYTGHRFMAKAVSICGLNLDSRNISSHTMLFQFVLQIFYHDLQMDAVFRVRYVLTRPCNNCLPTTCLQ